LLRAYAACDAPRPNLHNKASISAAGFAVLNRKPCTSLQPSLRNQSSLWVVSTPSAVVVMFRPREPGDCAHDRDASGPLTQRNDVMCP